jgi:hypothetical protein
MAKLRCGRKQAQNLYLQRGDEPGDDDEYLGVFFDARKLAALIDLANAHMADLDALRIPWSLP